MQSSKKQIPNLAQRRRDAGYTVTELAKVAGVGTGTIRRAEAGNTVREDSYRWIEDALKAEVL